MNSFLRRIECLKKRLGVVKLPPVTFIYMDGRERSMSSDEAWDEMCTRSDIKAVRCEFEDLKYLFTAMLPGCGNVWDDGDDSDMLEVCEYDSARDEPTVLPEAGD